MLRYISSELKPSYLKRDKALHLSSEIALQTFSEKQNKNSYFEVVLIWTGSLFLCPPSWPPFYNPVIFLLSDLFLCLCLPSCFLPHYYDRAPLQVGCSALRCVNGGFQLDDSCVGRASGVWKRVSMARLSRSGELRLKGVCVFLSIVLQVME